MKNILVFKNEMFESEFLLDLGELYLTKAENALGSLYLYVCMCENLY